MKPLDDKTLTARYLVRAAANLGRLREALQKYKDRTTALFPVEVDLELKVDLEIVLHRAETALNEEEARIGTRTAEFFERASQKMVAAVEATQVPPRNSKWYNRETGAVILVENAGAGVVDYRALRGGKTTPPTETASLADFHLTFRPDIETEKLRARIVRGAMWKAQPQAAEEFARLTVTVQGYSPSEDCVSFRAGGSNPVTYGVTCESFLDNFRPIRPGAA
jgi:hypothetical protein